MPAETVDLVLHSFLETFHDKKGNNSGSEAYGNTKDCDGMNSRSETLFLTVSDLSGYEVRQFQMIVTFLR